MKPDIALLKIRRRCIARDIAERTGGTKGAVMREMTRRDMPDTAVRETQETDGEAA